MSDRWDYAGPQSSIEHGPNPIVSSDGRCDQCGKHTATVSVGDHELYSEAEANLCAGCMRASLSLLEKAINKAAEDQVLGMYSMTVSLDDMEKGVVVGPGTILHKVYPGLLNDKIILLLSPTLDARESK